MAASRDLAVDDAPTDVDGVVQDAWALAARVQHEMLSEVTEETERLLREAEHARTTLLRHAADLQADALAELERAQAMHDSAVRAREEAERQADALRRQADAEAERTRRAAQAGAQERLAAVEREIQAVREEVARYRLQIMADAERDRERFLAETVEELERIRARERHEAERERTAMLDDAARRVERTLEEAAAAADARRARAEQDAAALVEQANARVDEVRAGVVREGRQEVERLLDQAATDGDRLRQRAEEDAQHVVTQAEGVAMLLRSEAARSFAQTLRRAEEQARAIVDGAREGDGPGHPAPAAVEPRADEPLPGGDEPTAPRPVVEPRRRRRLRTVLRVLAFAVVPALFLAVAVEAFVVTTVSIPTGSMRPELRPGDRVVVSRLSYVTDEPARGDVVAFDSPVESTDHPGAPRRLLHGLAEAVDLRDAPADALVKRVVALPGETVEGRGGRLLVDGRALREPYLDASGATVPFEPEEVPEGHVWVMDDDREATLDSRTFGALETDAIWGRAVFRVWPPLRVGTV
jgi:signal peptidase I